MLTPAIWCCHGSCCHRLGPAYTWSLMGTSAWRKLTMEYAGKTMKQVERENGAQRERKRQMKIALIKDAECERRNLQGAVWNDKGERKSTSLNLRSCKSKVQMICHCIHHELWLEGCKKEEYIKRHRGWSRESHWYLKFTFLARSMFVLGGWWEKIDFLIPHVKLSCLRKHFAEKTKGISREEEGEGGRKVRRGKVSWHGLSDVFLITLCVCLF